MLIICLLVGVLAVARITRLLYEDRLTASWRRWVLKRWGEESLPSYLVHCPWCMSIWVSIPVMPVAVLVPYYWPWLSFPVIALLAIPAASYLTGKLEE